VSASQGKISRRTLLTAVAAAAAGLNTVAACTGRTPDTPGTKPPQSPSQPPSSTRPVVPPDWAALRARLPGGLVLPGENGYDTARRSYNPQFDSRQPAAVARCTRPADVQACVEVARNARIPLAARGGGHSYAGYSTPDSGLVADLRPMSQVRVEPDGTAVVGAGARLMEVYAALAESGRCLPAGSCPTVGVAGLTLGGGIGVLARKYGLTCDRLTAAEVVTADGTVRTVSGDSSDGADLFWALRGGGGGNFGVVTSFTFATEPAPDVVVFSARYPAGSVADALGAWQEWLGTAPPELWSNCVISAGTPPACRIGGSFVGSEADCHALLDQLPAASKVRVTTKDYLAAMRYFGGCSQRGVEACRPQPAGGELGRESFVASSRMLYAPVDPAALVGLVDGHMGLDVLLDSLGGAVSAVEPAATAFPHRKALASAQIYASAGGAATQSVAEIRDGLGTLAGPHGYVNYIDPTMPDWASAYYGDNLARLRQVADRYDPDAVFGFAQAVTAPDR
jgi:FAD/FMN-containing dehydrogenase